MTGRRTAPKTAPDQPSVPRHLDQAPPSLVSGARWDGVQADGDTEAEGELAGVELVESSWRNANLAGRRLAGFRCRDMRFDHCDLSGALLGQAALTRVSFVGCRLTGIVLSGATLQDVYVVDSRADLANLRMAKADFLRFEDSSLREADFYQSVLARSALTSCDLTAANFQDASTPDLDLQNSVLDGLRGALSLRGAKIGAHQIVALAPALLSAAGISVASASS